MRFNDTIIMPNSFQDMAPLNKLAVLGTLTKAKAQLRERGHCQGTLVDSKGRVCALGAINVAATGDPNSDGDRVGTSAVVYTCESVLDRVVRARTKYGRTNMGSIVGFNDCTRTRLSQVERVYDLAIEAVTAAV